jgi:glycerol-3-phosphate dehydrogenase (NAD(P)+)
MTRTAIIGGGAWGCALALTVKRAGANPIIWSRNAHIRDALKGGRHPAFSTPLDHILETTDALPEALDRAELIFLVIPAQSIRAVLSEIALQHITAPFILCAKGIESDTGKPPSAIFKEFFPKLPHAILSGPNFAEEIAANLPAASVIAAKDEALLQKIGSVVAHNNFRPYFNQDMKGVEICGAIKNILAIAAGIVEGKKLGKNARAALISRGLAEMRRYGIHHGGMDATFSGLAGIGDLMLTCTSTQSRNMRLGIKLAEAQQGKNAILELLNQKKEPLSEGFWTAKALYNRKETFPLPICDAVYSILYTEKTIDEALAELFLRPVVYET